MTDCFKTFALLIAFLPILLRPALADVPPTAPRYVLTDLGILPGGTYSTAVGINGKGQVVGGADTAAGIAHAVLWQNGRLSDLGVLPGDTISIARGINDGGWIAGESFDPIKEQQRGFLWRDGKMHLIGGLGRYGGVAGIDNSGRIAGRSDVVDPTSLQSLRRPLFLWQGEMRTLDEGSWSDRICLNGRGQIAGSENIGHGDSLVYQARLWDLGRWTDLSPRRVELQGQQRDSVAEAINDKGRVVVAERVTTAGRMTPSFLLWDRGTSVALKGLVGYPQALNDWGQIVGQRDVTGDSRHRHAFLWERGKTYDLNALVPPGSGLLLESADAINDVGQIVGFAERNGKGRGFLLTPKP